MDRNLKMGPWTNKEFEKHDLEQTKKWDLKVSNNLLGVCPSFTILGKCEKLKSFWRLHEHTFQNSLIVYCSNTFVVLIFIEFKS